MDRTLTAFELKSLLSAHTPIALLDVRRAAARAENPVAIPGAMWHDPEKLSQWIDDLDADREIVLYCVHGESISNTVVDALQAKGLSARFVEGGLDAWRMAGGDVVAAP